MTATLTFLLYHKALQIYRNNGNNTFSDEVSISIPNFVISSAAWGDYDNDGDPDILLNAEWNSGI